MSGMEIPEMIAGRWKMGDLLGQGGFGDVYEATDIHTGEPVAAKLEDDDFFFLSNEIETYEALRANSPNAPGFCKLLFHGKEGEFNVIVMSCLGPSLKDKLQETWGDRFSASTVVMIGLQLITRIQQLHKLGFSHEDMLIPNNMLLGKEDPTTIYLVDFGASTKISTNTTGPGSRRYDLLCLGCLLIRMLFGSTPKKWDGTGERQHAILDEVRKLCGDVPELIAYFEYAYEAGFIEDSDFDDLRQILASGLSSRGSPATMVFDWMTTS